jgi:histidinol dehydrogenase
MKAASRPSNAVETMPGLVVRKVWRPVDRVGLYIPGGKTPLFSTLLMLAIPALAAGVSELVVTTPPEQNEGGLDPVIALAAELCGIDAIWTAGGAQAIAALAFGAGDIPRVDKICGPGNAWVAEAKQIVSSMSRRPRHRHARRAQRVARHRRRERGCRHRRRRSPQPGGA